MFFAVVKSRESRMIACKTMKTNQPGLKNTVATHSAHIFFSPFVLTPPRLPSRHDPTPAPAIVPRTHAIHKKKKQLFFACASGNTTMARYLTRIEVGARYDLRDKRGHLAGEYFWDSVEPGVRDEIIAILVAVGWPDPPPSPRNGNGGSRGSVGLRSRGRLSGGGGGGERRRGTRNSSSAPPGNTGRRSSRGRGVGGRDDGGSKRHSEGGEAGMKRLASDMRLLMKRR